VFEITISNLKITIPGLKITVSELKIVISELEIAVSDLEIAISEAELVGCVSHLRESPSSSRTQRPASQPVHRQSTKHPKKCRRGKSCKNPLIHDRDQNSR
jgi:hypothetical protein